jgi:hypothetical protein
MRVPRATRDGRRPTGGSKGTPCATAFSWSSSPHLARHFFVGLGPEASTDLSRTYTPSSRNNQSTSVGAAVVVGAWL